ncbi:MAG: D-sedoheptulose-7-phosphate isomerase [Brevefilum sp.]
MIDHKTTINQYFTALKAVINNFPIEDLIELLSVLENARDEERAIFICGNGGSWATAAHMVCDFGKNTRMPDSKRMIVIGLGDNIPSLTAYANDEGYDRIFAEPLISLIEPKDVLIAISGSGNSPNVLRAVEEANARGGITLGLTGFEGGELVDKVDHCLVIPTDSMEMIEDFHMIVDHILTICLRKEAI